MRAALGRPSPSKGTVRPTSKLPQDKPTMQQTRPEPSDLSPAAQAMRPALGKHATVTPSEALALAKAADRALGVLAWLNGTAFASQAERERILGADLAQQMKEAQAALWRAGGPFRDRAGRVADRLLMA